MFTSVCEKLQFPAPATQTLKAALDVFLADPASAQALEGAAQRFTTAGSDDPMTLLAPMADAAGIPQPTAVMVCLVYAVPRLQALYAEKGISEDILWDTLIDLTCKLREHHDLCGQWGTDAVVWYRRVFTARIIKLGRMEFEPMEYKWETPYCGAVKGSPVMNLHIPSCGGLPPEAVLDSLKQAYRFFGDGKPMIFVGASWLLYPPLCEAVMGKDSNLYQFYRLFDILEQYEDPDNKNFWRIFNLPYSPGVLEKAPADTTLRRKLLAWMKAGNHMGVGRGAFCFDGEKVVNM